MHVHELLAKKLAVPMIHDNRYTLIVTIFSRVNKKGVWSCITKRSEKKTLIRKICRICNIWITYALHSTISYKGDSSYLRTCSMVLYDQWIYIVPLSLN